MTLAYGGLNLYNGLEAKSVVWANLSIYFQAGISPFIFLILCGFKRYIRPNDKFIKVNQMLKVFSCEEAALEVQMSLCVSVCVSVCPSSSWNSTCEHRNVQGKDIIIKRNVQGKDIKSEMNVQGIEITCKRNVQGTTMSSQGNVQRMDITSEGNIHIGNRINMWEECTGDG